MNACLDARQLDDEYTCACLRPNGRLARLVEVRVAVVSIFRGLRSRFKGKVSLIIGVTITSSPVILPNRAFLDILAVRIDFKSDTTLHKNARFQCLKISAVKKRQVVRII